jgi:hypothetical protein
MDEKLTRRFAVMAAAVGASALAIQYFQWQKFNSRNPWFAGVLVVLVGGVLIGALDGHRGIGRRLGLARARILGSLAALVVAVSAIWVTNHTFLPHRDLARIPARAEIEGQLGILNPVESHTYGSSATATMGEVLDAEVYYYNLENADSGDDARSLLVRINAPSFPGPAQLDATVAGSNTNLLELDANFSIPPNLDRSSDRWRVASGTTSWFADPLMA